MLREKVYMSEQPVSDETDRINQASQSIKIFRHIRSAGGRGSIVESEV
jgi:hypothetical protein